MRFDFRKPDARAAYWAGILGPHAKRDVLKLHELPLHSHYATNNCWNRAPEQLLRTGPQISAAMTAGRTSGGVTVELAGPGNIFFLLRRHSRWVGSTRHPARPQFFSGDVVLGWSVRLPRRLDATNAGFVFVDVVGTAHWVHHCVASLYAGDFRIRANDNTLKARNRRG